MDFVEQLLSRMCHYQHGHINAYLKPMLQRDFISLLPSKYTFYDLFNHLPLRDAKNFSKKTEMMSFCTINNRLYLSICTHRHLFQCALCKLVVRTKKKTSYITKNYALSSILGKNDINLTYLIHLYVICMKSHVRTHILV